MQHFIKYFFFLLTLLPSALISAERPNILFIFSDDHTTQAISSYAGDNKLMETPHIDSIAQEGAIFTKNFCVNAICAPSRAVVLTGKHSHKNGQFTNGNTFDGSQMTFPKLFKEHGYSTGIFGKWHLKSSPTGFDEWMVYPGQGSYYNPDYRTPNGMKRLEGYSIELTTDLSIDFMKKAQKENKSFMLMCQYKAPHGHWNPGPNYLDLFKDKTFKEPSTLFDNFEGRNSNAPKHKMGLHHMHESHLKIPVEKSKEWGRMTAEQKAAFKKGYEAQNKAYFAKKLSPEDDIRWRYQRYIKDYLRCVKSVDDNIGRLKTFLKENGLADNTIIVYSSDQGFFLGEHGWYDKRWMYDISLRMPLVMQWPAKFEGNQTITQITQNTDFAPTLLDAAGITVPAEMDGTSMLPLLTGQKPEWRDTAYYAYYESPGPHNVPFHEGVRTDKYKLIHYYESGEWELFDLTKDPGEMKSQYNNPEYKSVLKDLKKRLVEQREQYKAPEHEWVLNKFKRKKK
ncbi:MAG: sulfatase [Lentisphaerales bacterium]|nr:sulfatase [Lentisphaerales bacterium]